MAAHLLFCIPLDNTSKAEKGIIIIRRRRRLIIIIITTFCLQRYSPSYIGLNAVYNANEKKTQNELMTHRPTQYIKYKIIKCDKSQVREQND